MESSARKRWKIGWLIKAAGSFLLLGILFWILPLDAIIDGLRRVPPLQFFAVFVAFLVSHFVAAGKWWFILGRPTRFLLALRAHFGGLAANLCLPGALGGDAVRATMIFSTVKNKGIIAAGAIVDRMIDMLALVLISGIGVILIERQGVDVGIMLKASASIIVILIIVAIVVPIILPRLWDLFPRLPGQSIALKTQHSFSQLARNPRLLVFVQLLALLIQGVLVLLAYWLAVGVGLEVPLGAWVFAWPLAKILSILPLSLGGLGVREVTLAALLVPFGTVGAHVVAAGLAWQAVLFLTGGLGGLIVLLSRSRTENALVAGRIVE